MEVIFSRTGQRRYGVTLVVPGFGTQGMDPAPGFDPDVPHDLVHYLVEAELGLRAGVFGRAALGAGTFIAVVESGADKRARSRLVRKQKRREQSVRNNEAEQREMAQSERLAGLCDVAWRRRHGQAPSPTLWKEPERLSAVELHAIDRVLTRLDRVAALWRALPVGGQLTFAWPSTEPVVSSPSPMKRAREQ